MSRTLLVVACILFVSPAYAAPILLAEVNDIGSTGNVGSVRPVSFTASAQFTAGPPMHTAIHTLADVSDVGRTFEADAVTLAGLELVMTSNTLDAEWFITSGNYRFAESMEVFWTGSQDPYNAAHTTYNTFVPRLGPGFSGYDLTRITQTIDKLQWTVNYPYLAAAETAQTIRIYGEALPVYTYPSLDGDYNQSGTVDAGDYIVWRNAPPSTILPNTFGDPHPVAEYDYAIWRLHFGESVPPIGAASFAAIPEPATWLLMFVGVLLHISRRLRR